MKAIKLLLVILLVFAPGILIFSQRLVTGVSAGVGSYSMKDLKALNEAVKPPFDCKLVSDFPPYLYYQYSLVLDDEAYSYGMFYSYQSTGSRISAKDYSGEYYFDLNVHSNNLGMYLSMNLVSKNKFRVSTYAKPGLAFSKLEISENFTLLDTVLTDSKLSCVATAFFVEPGINFSWFILPAISIDIFAGYFLQMGGQNFHLKGEKDRVLVIPDTGWEIKPGWNGFRIGISMMYNLTLGK
jgi:hypothetical protein